MRKLHKIDLIMKLFSNIEFNIIYLGLKNQTKYLSSLFTKAMNVSP